MVKKKAIRILAAVSAAALLLGGTVLLCQDDAEQIVKDQEIRQFMPTPVVVSALEQVSEPVAETQISEVSDDGVCVTAKTVASPELPADVCEILTGNAEAMHNAYPDAIAWLYLPDTAISYPVMQSDDNDLYLHHAYDGSYLKAGSIFLDYRAENRFMNNINVLYGHNMKNGTMFADICKFKSPDYFDSHRYGWLFTPETVYRLDFFAVCLTDWNDSIYSDYADTATQTGHIRDIAKIYEDAEIADSDRLILLSTCSYEFQNARTVLVGRLTEGLGV